ncbi:MAG TPA: hypothetical protein DHV15_10235 [Treponema sp.]|uniref:Uncharacterized protein n=1 Tax=Treponema denticola (strain ATCC 35405 / DSM 14222 / CIP 103919 / JCM 8153 / KCTC 15104) TaxID=243275 RepID=Q73LC3_TREDE|nr:hypothetical protein TDE_1942 [Treponema denticola ATCC 35405]HCY95866.1 hypothetical protein [Treponema sp.]
MFTIIELKKQKIKHGENNKKTAHPLNEPFCARA